MKDVYKISASLSWNFLFIRLAIATGPAIMGAAPQPVCSFEPVFCVGLAFYI